MNQNHFQKLSIHSRPGLYGVDRVAESFPFAVVSRLLNRLLCGYWSLGISGSGAISPASIEFRLLYDPLRKL